MKSDEGAPREDLDRPAAGEGAPAPFASVLQTRRRVLSLSAIRSLKGIVALVGFAVLGILLPLYYQFRGDGKLEVIAAGGRRVSLFVDGKPLEPTSVSGDHRVYLTKPGKHAVQIRDTISGSVTAEHLIDLDSPSTHLIIPTDRSQCFAHVNLTKRMEQRANGTGDWPPEVARRFDATPFERPQWTYLSPAELPARVEPMSMVFLLLPIDCASPDPTGAEILRRTGVR